MSISPPGSTSCISTSVAPSALMFPSTSHSTSPPSCTSTSISSADSIVCSSYSSIYSHSSSSCLFFLYTLCLVFLVLPSPLLVSLSETLFYVMGFPLNATLKACSRFDVHALSLCLVPCFPHNKFSKGPAEHLPNSRRTPPDFYPELLGSKPLVHNGGRSHPVVQLGRVDS